MPYAAAAKLPKAAAAAKVPKVAKSNEDVVDKRPSSYNVQYTPSRLNKTSEKTKIKAQIKDKISKAIRSVKTFINRASSSTPSSSKILKKLNDLEEKKLDNLQNDMIKIVEETAIEDVVVTSEDNASNNDILTLFGDVFKNITIELHNVIGNTEQTRELLEEPKNEGIQKKVLSKELQELQELQGNEEQKEPNISSLNAILEAVADNFYDPNNKKMLKKDLLFTTNISKDGQSTFTIRAVSLGISINYTTMKEFFDKIASRIDFALNLCWFIGCPENLVAELKTFKSLHANYNKNPRKVFSIFKKIIKIYLDSEKNKPKPRTYPIINSNGKRSITKRTTEIPETLTSLLQSSASSEGGYKRMVKKAKKIGKYNGKYLKIVKSAKFNYKRKAVGYPL
jgi:hypothetical protein